MTQDNSDAKIHPIAVESEIRVRYAETDAQGVVYYANYFVWFEVARVNFMRQLGLSYAELEQKGLGFVIAEAGCRYHAPAHFDELLVVRTWVTEVANSSFVMEYEVVRRDDGRRLATGRTVQVMIGAKQRPIRIPDEMRALLTKGRV